MWEAANKSMVTSWGQNKSCISAVWALSAQAEQQVGNDNFVALLLWDLKAFYEHIDRNVLIQRATEAGCPMQPTRLAIQGYASQRLLKMDNLIVTTGFAKFGVVAGCGFATTGVKVYVQAPLLRWAPGQARVLGLPPAPAPRPHPGKTGGISKGANEQQEETENQEREKETAIKMDLDSATASTSIVQKRTWTQVLADLLEEDRVVGQEAEMQQHRQGQPG